MTSVLAPLSGALAKIERAKKHVGDLESVVAAFLKSDPYGVGFKKYADASQSGYYITRVAAPPTDIALIAGDVLQNLRSALDYFAFQVVAKGVNGPFKPWEVEYPIADSAAEYPNLRKGKVKGAQQDAIDAINTTKPYLGGNDALWRLHKLANVDRHRLLITVGSAFRSLDLGGYTIRMAAKQMPDSLFAKFVNSGGTLPVFFRTADRLFPLKEGDPLLLNVEFDEKMQFRFDVAFGEPGILEGEPILETLQQMANLVDGIVRSFASVV
jgi:hypothetical protein